MVFPEGRPSPDGAIGPVRGGAGMLVRRGRPESVLPVGIAYDPLSGCPHAFVAFGERLDDLAGNVEASILHALMRTTPLTCGQVVAGRLVDVADAGLETVSLADLDTVLQSSRARCDGGWPAGRPIPSRYPREAGETVWLCGDAQPPRARAHQGSPVVDSRSGRDPAERAPGPARARVCLCLGRAQCSMERSASWTEPLRSPSGRPSSQEWDGTRHAPSPHHGPGAAGVPGSDRSSS